MNNREYEDKLSAVGSGSADLMNAPSVRHTLLFERHYPAVTRSYGSYRLPPRSLTNAELCARGRSQTPARRPPPRSFSQTQTAADYLPPPSQHTQKSQQFSVNVGNV